MIIRTIYLVYVLPKCNAKGLKKKFVAPPYLMTLEVLYAKFTSLLLHGAGTDMDYFIMIYIA